MSSAYIFTVCQPGSEAALKQEIAREHPNLRFAFSRPGFVTFRIPDDAARGDDAELRSTFARTWGFSLGKVTGADREQLARDFWRALGVWRPPEHIADFAHLHVWHRNSELPGDAGFDPDATADARAIGERLLAHRPNVGGQRAPALNEVAVRGDQVLDCVIVEPNEWWFGVHRARSPETCWPGGVPTLPAPANMISRAYRKLAEALLWSELPLQAGDRCVEIGSAPGGSCQWLLERGCIVTGIDPAEMDPRVRATPGFTHVRARAKDLKRSVFEEFRWLMSDANVAPNYTLDTVEAIVTWPKTRLEGLVLTLKLTDPKLTAALPTFVERIRSWGYRRVRTRQLAFNRQEVCAVATDRA